MDTLHWLHASLPSHVLDSQLGIVSLGVALHEKFWPLLVYVVGPYYWVVMGPISLMIFYHNCCDSNPGYHISCIDTCPLWMCFKRVYIYFHKTRNLLLRDINKESFGNTHPRSSVVAGAKFWSDMIPYNVVTLKSVFRWIWITMGNLFVKWAASLFYDSKSFCLDWNESKCIKECQIFVSISTLRPR